MPTRTFVVAAAVVGAAALATTGITYASIADPSESATSGHRAAAPVQPSAPSAHRPTPTSPPLGDGTAHGQRDDHQQGHGQGNGQQGHGQGNSQQGHTQQGGGQQGGGQQGGSQQGGSQGNRPQQGSGQENGSQGSRDQGRDGNDRNGNGRDGDRDGSDRDGGHGSDRGHDGDRGHEDRGRIYFNDRTYSAQPDGCVTAASGLGSSSFSVYNDSRMVIEVFRGFTCDNGAPVATVGPHGTGYGVVTRSVQGGLFGDDGVAGSFRVIDHDDW
ncbi:hypothetical protein [Streptomyces sp. NPDC007264]|uniref:hypothetical protein n=1 Tax=Streptomyces sp. NPDC007264 TaxID=3364777 RepID=UPI0036DCF1C1